MISEIKYCTMSFMSIFNILAKISSELVVAKLKGVSRTAISIPSELMKQLDDLISKMGLRSRSKAISEAISLYLAERYWVLSDADTEVTGVIIIIYDHHGGLEVTEVQHEYLDLIKSASHIHVDEERCLEVIMVMGQLSRVRQLFRELQPLKSIEMIKPFLVPIRGKEFPQG